ncbi:DUF839 domain-containing protein [Sabulilitoribacter multivorans]|uniref:DUF839 domain-containing protein n=1 Tax=Flaviramulus multivorans TaxID=1304750 RepID=A0ABS9IJE1_9FLAO|nr:alkaline phosphatase PhoX [Flaviramulus multivorans]MCF7560719.1 DUF839 domain-containing protein [Flaviramulus multivorans]
MQSKLHFKTLIILLGFHCLNAQNIADFTSVTPASPIDSFVIPSSHTFQMLAIAGDVLTAGGTLPDTPDFTGYVPIANSSTNGYLSLNHEKAPGDVTVFDLNLNGTTNLWEVTASQAIDFTAWGDTAANCSGTVTSWGTVISCEEFAYIPGNLIDFNFDGYNDVGWNVEIDPATKTVIGKHWAMGNMAHENVVIHSNDRTVYQGADSNPGYLYKFVANTAQDLSSGDLYVFSGSKSGVGAWIQINNTTQDDRNKTIELSAAAGATVFNGIEDVEIGPDGMVYFAVKGEGRVYRFSDSDVLETTTSTVTMETYVGGMSYDINDGSSTTSVAWGNGNDNLAFDGQGNLWVLQDSGNAYIWVVKNGHTQASPDVEIFGISPTGSEPTGITFTPDFKYLFLSIQHPSSGNVANQTDAAGNVINFDDGTTLVLARNENLGAPLSINNEISKGFKLYPNPINETKQLHITGKDIKNVRLYSILGEEMLNSDYDNVSDVDLIIKNYNPGLYLLRINNQFTSKLIIE